MYLWEWKGGRMDGQGVKSTKGQIDLNVENISDLTKKATCLLFAD